MLWRETVKTFYTTWTVVIRLVWIVACVQASKSIFRIKTQCPDDFEAGPPGKCYHLLTAGKPFSISKTTCEDLNPNSKLALAKTEAEHAFLCDIGKTAKRLLTKTYIWLGAVQNGHINYHKYHSIRTGLAFVPAYYYIAWGPNQPNHPTQRCIGFDIDDCSHHDIECHKEFQGICETLYTDTCGDPNNGCEGICIRRAFNYTYCDCGNGHQLDGKNCVDIDECASNNGGCLQKCQNTIGGYTCYQNCSKGFQPNSVTGDCEDINECNYMNGFCHQICINKPNGDGFKCECSEGFVMLKNQTCSNNVAMGKMTGGEKGQSSVFFWICAVISLAGVMGAVGIAVKTNMDVQAIENANGEFKFDGEATTEGKNGENIIDNKTEQSVEQVAED